MTFGVGQMHGLFGSVRMKVGPHLRQTTVIIHIVIFGILLVTILVSELEFSIGTEFVGTKTFMSASKLEFELEWFWQDGN